MIQLTDGRVMVQEEGTAHWHALKPDANGSYLDGTWPTLADMSIWRRYYASAVLNDGRVLVIGGEDSGAGGDTNKCEMYDPVAGAWTPTPSPAGWTQVGDACSCLLPDGGLIIGALPSDDCTICPAMLTYDGRVIFFGAADVSGLGRTVRYTPPPIYTGAGAWAKGPNIPKIGGVTHVCNDCPASLLPNGKLPAACAPYVHKDWGSPISFIEFDPFTEQIVQAPTPVNNAAQVYWSRFALLPTGQVLFSPSSNDAQCYEPDGAPQDPWRPVVEWVGMDPLVWPGADYLLRGKQLNGLWQANIYGDDCSPATNYSLVRLDDESTGGLLRPNVRIRNAVDRLACPWLGPLLRQPGSLRSLPPVGGRERDQVRARRLRSPAGSPPTPRLSPPPVLPRLRTARPG